ncbi:peroxiredoxin [Paenibacillus sp. FSL H8-0537]|uniref:peroxiredoxin n=1 Tax=Paenibacillus sp. FSL H8-0537 TaxID=2921399 RepID=UPI003100FCD9
MKLAIGDQAPDFTLSSTGPVNAFTLSEQRGKFSILFFYPKDGTPGCTSEGCAIRDRYEDLTIADAVVVGISPDHLQSHEQFSALNGFQFPLLSDEDLTVAGQYRVVKEKKFLGKTIMGIERATYIIDPEGKVAHIFEQVDPLAHAQELVDTLRKLVTAISS